MGCRILVTGGAGYIGAILVPELLQAGHKVTVIDNFMYGQHTLGHVCSHPDFDVVRGDVRSNETMAPLLKKADIIIPLAAYVGAPLCDRDPVGATSTNKDAVISMVKALSKEQRVLVPITNSGYGVGEKDAMCTEETLMRPISLYGRDKVDAENTIMERGNAISFRLATVFGMSPRMRLDLLVNDFTYRAVHDRFIVLFESHFRRNFVHVRDVARAFLYGINNFEALKGEAYNVGLSEANLTKRELCERIKKQLPKFVIMEAEVGEDPDKRDYIVSNDKIEKTGFKATHSLDSGIAELIKGFTMIRNSRFSNV
ncbi:MAG: NAD-dependent epimerase/dehydratase [Candidatus Omnitrophota bacterium]|nr:NAD-dependent epimerase/dehydratase [Candidatus Omnitrophota bacterium]